VGYVQKYDKLFAFENRGDSYPVISA